MYRNIVFLQDGLANRVKNFLVFNTAVLSLDFLSDNQLLVIGNFHRKGSSGTRLQAFVALLNRLFDILRIKIAASYDDQIFTPASHKKLAILQESQISCS